MVHELTKKKECKQKDVGWLNFKITLSSTCLFFCDKILNAQS